MMLLRLHKLPEMQYYSYPYGEVGRGAQRGDQLA